ncbi:MAG: hypothetical protein ACRCZ9_05290 [Fusobacteriaceae bacterium]
MVSKKKLFWIIAPLLLGIFIYMFFRSRHLFYYKFLHITELSQEIDRYRIFLWQYRKFIPNWFIYSLPDGLWIFSFGIAFLYENKFFTINSLIFLGITFFMIGFEFFQLRFGGTGSLVGTFDLADIYCFVSGSFTSILLSFFSIKNNRNSLNQKLKHYNSKSIRSSIFIILIFITLAVLPTLFKS